MKLLKSITVILLGLAVCTTLAAQEKSAEQLKKEKEFYESIQKTVENYETLLELEAWQAFYVDSILTHDYTAMQEEVDQLVAKKVSNADLFYEVQDKWMEKMYVALNKVFDEDQWAKYLKSGAAREKKARDKRAAKKK